MGFLFEQLDVYRKSSLFAKEVLQFTSHVAPKNYALADQLRRAAMSIPANIAEGWGQWHVKEKRQFYGIAMGSTNECVAFLEFAHHQGMITTDQLTNLNKLLIQVAQMINGLSKTTLKPPQK